MGRPAGPLRAAIAGGSMAGLFCGLMLRRIGWDVQIYERAGRELSGRGAGIVTHEELRAALRSCGVETDHDLGVVVQDRVTLGQDGTLVARMDRPQTMTAWDRLHRLLRQAFPPAAYHLGRAVVAAREEADRVTVRLSDGSEVTADLLVAADGIRSTVRAQFLPEVAPAYAGYVAWRGLVAEAAMTPATRAMIFESFAFCLPPDEQILGYPVAGAGDDLRPGHRRYNFVWYRPADPADELPRLLTDIQGRRHEGAIPPPLIRPEVIARMRADAQAILAPQFAELVAATDLPLLQPVFDLESPAMACGHVALIGDAAFVARPHVGAGVTKAAMDARALADALGGMAGGAADIPRALAAFTAARLPQGRRIVAFGRQLGADLRRPRAETDPVARHQEAQEVMADTALLDFLYR